MEAAKLHTKDTVVEDERGLLDLPFLILTVLLVGTPLVLFLLERGRRA